MFGLKILFWIFAIMLVLVIVVSFCNSTSSKGGKERKTDLLVGVVAFAVFIVLFKVFGGYVI